MVEAIGWLRKFHITVSFKQTMNRYIRLFFALSHKEQSRDDRAIPGVISYPRPVITLKHNPLSLENVIFFGGRIRVMFSDNHPPS